MPVPTKTITAKAPAYWAYLAQTWHHRHVLQALYVRDIKQQYVQTRLGLLWGVIRPLVVVGVFSVLFSYLMNIRAGNYPYLLFALSGHLSWSLFSSIVNNGMSIVKGNANLVRKMNFPLLILPLLSIANALTEWAVTFAILLVLMAVFGILPPLQFALLPLAVLLNVLLASGIILWLNVASIRYWDLNHIVPSLIGLGIWLTPVFFPVTLIPGQYAWLADLNPMTGVLNLYRWALFDDVLNGVAIGWSALLSLATTLSGIYFFKEREGEMIDYL
ncbi:MAG: ABC transporter permease [Flavobacteriales bacterium]|nr:ABC transporter permease [Flavobacteriales bacterium]